MPAILVNVHPPLRDCCLILDGLQKNCRMTLGITGRASGLAKGRWRLKSNSRLYSFESEQDSPGVSACEPGNNSFQACSILDSNCR